MRILTTHSFIHLLASSALFSAGSDTFSIPRDPWDDARWHFQASRRCPKLALVAWTLPSSRAVTWHTHRGIIGQQFTASLSQDVGLDSPPWFDNMRAGPGALNKLAMWVPRQVRFQRWPSTILSPLEHICLDFKRLAFYLGPLTF